ncbi:MAG: RDD family protein [Phaeodactylibacter sp.]|nr:RDD family protein [Phaeodactylibacter sp.]
MERTGRKRNELPKMQAGKTLAWGASLLLLLWAVPLFAQVSVSAELSQNDILIGDQVRLTILSYYQPPTEIADVGFSVLQETAGLELLGEERFEKDNGEQGKLLEVQLTVTAFDSGYYRIAPIPVAYRQNGKADTAWTAELALQAHTIPLASDTARIMPIKEIIGEPMNVRDALPWILGLILLIGLGLLVFFLLRRPPPPLPPPPPLKIAAHQLALGQLDQLEGQKLWQQGLVKDYHSGLAHIMRQYLQHRYGLSAMESTTDEILQQLGLAGLSNEHQDKLRRLLQSADLVKFAKALPPATYHTEASESARAFLRDTADEGVEVEIPRKIPGFDPEQATEKQQAPPPYILDAEGWPVLLSGFWRRFWARLLDMFIFPGLLLAVVNIALGGAIAPVVLALAYVGVLWLYHAIMDHYMGGTAGKLLLGIRVVDDKAVYPTLGQSALRFLGKLASEAVFGLGYLLYFLNGNRRQALHDRMAGTYVIRKRAPEGERPAGKPGKER